MNIICINCPRGCLVKIDKDGTCFGNFCIKGEQYAKQELVSPSRVITSTVCCQSIVSTRLPVKTNAPIPKNKMFLVMEEIKKVIVNPPIQIGDVILKDVLGLGVDIISTKEIL